MKDNEDFSDNFWREMNEMASFKDFYSPEKKPANETDELALLRHKIDRVNRQISELASQAQIMLKDLQNALEGLK